MGIQGLLPLLKECQRVAHISEYKGQTLGIDAYVWLHRGAYGCAQEIATGQATVKYIKYAIHKIRLLQHHGIKPYIVFDGGPLPSKRATEKDREGRRNEALAAARALTLEGKHAQAREYYVKAVDVTPQMAYQLIKVLKAENIPYVVAPYEADAQLAYLEKKGLIDGILTEDSDLIVFGCQKVLFKLDSDGRCVEFKRDNLTMCKDFSFSGWTNREFRQMAILSGCDYLESIPGLGLKTAHGLMRRYKTAEKVIRFVRLEGQLKVPRNYEDEFKRAELTFLHQRVFCPMTDKLAYLEELEEHVIANLASPQAEEIKFIGPFLEDEIAKGIAQGNLCPISKAKMIDIAPNAETLAANPVPSAAPTKGSIKDYFKRSPAAPKTAEKSNRKRTALGELKPNNLFSAKAEEVEEKKAVTAPTKAIKSRFFVSGGNKTAQPKMEVVRIEDSDDDFPLDVAAEARSKAQRGTSAINHARGAPESCEYAQASGTEYPTTAEALTCINECMVTTVDEIQISSQEGHSLPSINTSQDLKVMGEIRLPRMPTPAPPASTELQSTDDDAVYRSSSPGLLPAFPRPRKLRRYKSPSPPQDHLRDDSQKFDDSDTTPSLSSPVDEAQTNIKVSHSSETRRQTGIVEKGPDYLEILSSPVSSIAIESQRAAQARRAPQPQLNTEVQWSDDDEQLPESNETVVLQQLPKLSGSGKMHVKKPTARLPRSKAVLEGTPNEANLEVEAVQQQMSDFEKRVSSVVAGWRNKYSSSATKPSKNRGSSATTSSSSPFAPRGARSKPVLSPLRSSKQANTAIPDCSSPIMSSTPPSIKKPTRASDRSGSPITSSSHKAVPEGKDFSIATLRSLEAFRYRPAAAST